MVRPTDSAPPASQLLGYIEAIAAVVQDQPAVVRPHVVDIVGTSLACARQQSLDVESRSLALRNVALVWRVQSPGRVIPDLLQSMTM